jgi:hypothetical protein
MHEHNNGYDHSFKLGLDQRAARPCRSYRTQAQQVISDLIEAVLHLSNPGILVIIGWSIALPRALQ